MPIWTRLTAHEIAFLVGDADPRIVVASDTARRRVLRAAAGARRRCCPWATALPPSTASEAPWPLVLHSDDCMIGYTSGTSGTPKGAITTHDNLLLVAMYNNFDYGLQRATTGFW